MPIAYRKDILAELKKKGYNTNKLRKEKLLSEGVIQSLREGKEISWKNIAQICDLLECEPGDILARVDSEGRDASGFIILSKKQKYGV